MVSNAKDPQAVRTLRIFPLSDEYERLCQRPESGTINFDGDDSLLRSLSTATESSVAIGMISTDVPTSYSDALNRQKRLYWIANRLFGKTAFVLGSMGSKADAEAVIELYYSTELKVIFLLGWIPSPQAEKTRQKSLQMQQLLFTSCQYVFQIQESSRFNLKIVKDIQSLWNKKQELLGLLTGTSSKQSKQAKGSTYKQQGISFSPKYAFTPGYCTPFLTILAPVHDESVLSNSEALRNYNYTMENVLFVLLRTLPPGVISVSRTREAFTAMHLTKCDKLFQLDVSHPVVFLSRSIITSKADLVVRLNALLDSLEKSIDGGVEPSLLEHVPHEERGLDRTRHIMNSHVKGIFDYVQTGVRSGRKESTPVTEPPSPKKWLLEFHKLHSLVIRGTDSS
uniref:Nonsense-mediated mRNA decay factor SMG8 n=1 Tax=Albugo laibachii Nc14 TaxID=890382 RepID=F0WD67_9STRA|nr:conserved hypothetical protein [Albugo laibachii Nc14]|eukprot:CCA19139.1 conserved hypothetical protein [Albugo laibachii Nc14]